MSLFNSKKMPVDSSAPSGDDGNPLRNVTVENGSFKFAAVNDNHASGGIDDESRARVQEAIERLYSDTRFHGHIIGLLSWVGKKKHISSLQVSHDDEAFKSACEVVYRRLMDGPIGPLLDRLGDKALEDLIICMAGFGPVAVSAMSEIRQRKKSAQASNENVAEGTEDE